MSYSEPLFELRLAVSLDGVKLQYRAKDVVVNSWHDVSRIDDWSDWHDVPTVAIKEKDL
jgi:hypothetical protein